MATSLGRSSLAPRSHKGIARKAFERVTKRVLPPSHVRLRRALAAEARSYGAKVGELERSRDGRAAEARGSDDVAQADVSAGEGGA